MDFNKIPYFFLNLSFASANFYVFSLLVLGVYYFVFKKHQNLLLLIVSYLFCASWDWVFVVTIFLSSVINYLIGLRLDISKHKRKVWLWVGVLANISILFFFKYINQYSDNLFRAFPMFSFTKALTEYHFLQPLGLSFYTLQAISYLVDVYQKQIQANKSFLEISLFLAYFPKLFAGPIERPLAFFKQLQSTQIINNEDVNQGLLRIFIGLTRKIVISDPIMRIMPKNLFTHPENYTSFDLIFWWLVFTMVIYNDFAGYTSIARGVSGLFGIKLSPNFEQPFFSNSYIDFWNRWHISFSNWLKNYIYLPVSRAMLRRNPNGRYWPNLVIPPLITMIISGIWHGANLHFVIWGILNGMLQAVERLRKSRQSNRQTISIGWKQLINTIIVFLVLLLINVPFKFDLPQVLIFWGKLLNWEPLLSTSLRLMVKPILLTGLSFFIDCTQLIKKDELGIQQLPKNVKIFLLAIGIILLFFNTRQQLSTPFIYQEF